MCNFENYVSFRTDYKLLFLLFIAIQFIVNISIGVIFGMKSLPSSTLLF